MTPIIKYRKNEDFGIIHIDIGFPYQLDKLEEIIREKLIKVAIENGYSEIEMVDNDFSIPNYVIIHYSFTRI
jgi:hypothetical protein